MPRPRYKERSFPKETAFFLSYILVTHLVRASRLQIGKVAGSCPALATKKSSFPKGDDLFYLLLVGQQARASRFSIGKVVPQQWGPCYNE